MNEAHLTPRSILLGKLPRRRVTGTHEHSFHRLQADIQRREARFQVCFPRPQPLSPRMGQVQGLHNRSTEKPELPCSLPARNAAFRDSEGRL